MDDEVFQIDEIFLQLAMAAGPEALRKLNTLYPEKVNDPHIIEAVTRAKMVPYDKFIRERNKDGIFVWKKIKNINNFADLIFSLELRLPHRLNSCLREGKILKIAVNDQDLELFKEFPDHLWLDDVKILTEIGKTGNVKFIEFALSKIQPFHFHDVLAGLVEVGLNEMLYEHILVLASQYDYYKHFITNNFTVMSPECKFIKINIAESFLVAASKSDNVPIFIDFLRFVKIIWSNVVYFAAYHGSKNILKIIESSEKTSHRDNLEALFKGYIAAGNAEAAKDTYEKNQNFLEEFESSTIVRCLPEAILSGSVKTLLYAEKLNKKITGLSTFDEDRVDIILRNRIDDGLSDNDTFWYYLTQYPDQQDDFIYTLLSSDDLKSLIKFTKLFLSHSEPRELLEKFKNLPNSNKCYIKWLELQQEL